MTAVTNIAVINGKPTLSADIMHAIVRNNPEYAGVQWKSQNDNIAEVIIKRKGINIVEEFRGYYDLKMAEVAGLTKKDSWIKYPARMLKHRALSFALRDAFPDVLAGLYNPDEMVNVTPEIEVIENVNDNATDANSEKAVEETVNDIFEHEEKEKDEFFTKGTKDLLLKAAELGKQLPQNLYDFYKTKLENLKLIKNIEVRFNDTKQLLELMAKDVEAAKSENQPEIF